MLTVERPGRRVLVKESGSPGRIASQGKKHGFLKDSLKTVIILVKIGAKNDLCVYGQTNARVDA